MAKFLVADSSGAILSIDNNNVNYTVFMDQETLAPYLKSNETSTKILEELSFNEEE